MIPIAPHQNGLLQQLWQEVDEQSLPLQLRRELLAQGFRVGILGNLLSPALAELLKVSSDGKAATNWDDFREISAADALRESSVTRNLHCLLPEMRTLVKVFNDQNTLPELPLFWADNGTLCGQTYRDVLGLICVSATANKDGSAHIQIVPELEHGVYQQRFRVVSGMVVQDNSRPRHTFESLTISQRLLPGQWLIMGTTTLDSAGAGKVFFTRKTPVPEQRLLAIRFVNATTVTAPQRPSPSTAQKEAETPMPERN